MFPHLRLFFEDPRRVWCGDYSRYFGLLPLDTKESVLRDFFREEAVEFVSATEVLRNAAAEGRQVYYTYDQHWTAAGHVVVAEELYRYLTESNTPPLH